MKRTNKSNYLYGLISLASASMAFMGFTFSPDLARYDHVTNVNLPLLVSVLKTPKFTDCAQLRHILSKVQGSGYGYESDGYGYEPSGYGYEPSGYGYEPSGYGYEPSGYGYEPSGYGYEPSGYGYEPSGYGYEPSGYGYEPSGYGYEPRGNDAGYQRAMKLVRKAKKKLLRANHSMGCGLEGEIESLLR